jgi:hypothetical protein
LVLDLKYYVKENMYFGFEVLHRKLFTDFVDDVSHRYYIDPIYFDQYLPAADAVKPGGYTTGELILFLPHVLTKNLHREVTYNKMMPISPAY